MLMKLSVSISPTFYKQLFQNKVFFKAFIRLQFDFVIFYQNNIDAKAAFKMLLNLTPGVNFINILHLPFLFEIAMCNFSLITVWAL